MTDRIFSPFAKQCYVTTAVGINLIGHGAVVGFPAVLLPQLQQQDSDISLSKSAASWIASVVGITLLVGNFLVTPIMGPLGRKVAHYVISVSAIVGWVVAIFATSFEALLVARIIQGVSFGMMLPLRSILIGEYTSPKNRGAFLTTVSFTQGFGIFFVHLVGSLLSWQKTAIICVFLPFTSLVMTLYTPESPSWLAAKGRYRECRDVFHWLRGDEEDDELEEMIRARLEFDHKKTTTVKVTYLKVIVKKEFYKPIILMIHSYISGQLAGANVMAAYSTTIIKLILRPDVNAEAWMIALDSLRIVVNLLAVYVINRCRRRTMIFSTGALCIASYMAIVLYVCLRKFGGLLYDNIWLPGIFIILQFFAMSLGMIPLPSVLAGEVFPLEYRSIAGSFSLIGLCGSMFLVLKTFPGLVDAVGIEGTYAVYGGIIWYSLVVIWFLLPETKDRTLQQIEDEFRGRPKEDREVEEMQTLNCQEMESYRSKNNDTIDKNVI